MDALGRLVVDPDLAKSDPTREPLEEPIALGELLERCGCARRQQAEVACISRNFLPRSPVDQRVKDLDAGPAQPRLVSTVRLGRVDHVIAVVEPMRDELFKKYRGMLSVAVHE